MTFYKTKIKALVFSLILVLAVSFSAACSSPESAAQKAAGDFLRQLNTFHDVDKIIDNASLIGMQGSFAEKFKSYMTAEAFNSFYAERMGYIAVLVGFYNKSSVDVENVILELKSKEEKTSTFYYDYTVDVKLTPLSGSQTTTTKITGQIGVTKGSGEWKINSFYILSKDWFVLARRIKS